MSTLKALTAGQWIALAVMPLVLAYMVTNMSMGARRALGIQMTPQEWKESRRKHLKVALIMGYGLMWGTVIGVLLHRAL